MTEQSETAGKGAAAANRSESKAAAREKPQAEATLDDVAADPDAAHPSTCSADNCELGKKMSKWAGLDNFECPRCGYATVSEDTARARNPKHFN